MFRPLSFFIGLSFLFSIGYGANYQPEQIHLSYTSSLLFSSYSSSRLVCLAIPNEMTVTWSTQLLTNNTVVEYSLVNDPLNLSVNATLSTFHDGSTGSRTLYFYRATMKNLKMNTTYSKIKTIFFMFFVSIGIFCFSVYHVGSPLGWSSRYSFRTILETDRKSFAVYGDLGVVNAQSLPRLQREAQLNYYDAILHVGDFAYGKFLCLVVQKTFFFSLDMETDAVRR